MYQRPEPKTDNTFPTPFGKVDRGLIQQLMQVAGLRWDKEYKDWMILSERCQYWRKNTAEDRKYNEKAWFKADGYLPIRFFNYQIALHKCNGDHAKALFMADIAFIVNGKAVYLPDRVNERLGLSPDERHYTYGRIFREIDELEFD